MGGFYITIKNGLLDPKHIKAMGGDRNVGTVWLFLWLLDKMTIIDHEQGIGKVLGGKPIKFKEINMDLGISRRTYHRWLEMLKIGGYITTLRTPYGLCITVHKAFKVFNQRCASKGTSDKKRYSVGGTSDTALVAHHPTVGGTSNKTIQLDNTIDKQIKDLQISFLFQLYQRRIRQDIKLTQSGKEICRKMLGKISCKDIALAIYNKSTSDWWVKNPGREWSFRRFLSNRNKLEEYAQENSNIPESVFSNPKLQELLKQIRKLKDEHN